MNELNLKIEAFLNKYYQNMLLKGLIYFLSISLSLFIAISVLEYFGRFNSTVRLVFFYGSISTFAFLLYSYLFIPIFRLYGLQKRMNYKEAARIIGKAFPEVSDKLLNALQLQELSLSNKESELIIAGLNQKTIEMKPIAFNSAIHFSENRKYLPYLIPPMMIFLVIFLSSPSVFREASNRVISYNTNFIPPAPFTLSLVSNDLNCRKGSDFTVEVEAVGEVTPNEVFLYEGTNKFRMQEKERGFFSFKLKNVQKTSDYTIKSDFNQELSFKLKVLSNPTIVSMEAHLSYPKYLGKEEEKLQNIGDLVLPEGTKVSLIFNTREAVGIHFFYGDSLLETKAQGPDKFSTSFQALATKHYSFVSKGSEIDGSDTSKFLIQVIKDEYPKIELRSQKDSSSEYTIYFQGMISDDYGFADLSFVGELKDAGGVLKTKKTFKIPFNRGSKISSFFHDLNLEDVGASPGDKYVYYFMVRDNDGVNGPKTSRSQEYVFNYLSGEEISKKAEQSNSESQASLQAAIEAAKEIQKEIDELRKKLADKKQLDFNDKEQLKKLLEVQKQLQKQFENLKEENKKSIREQEKFGEQSESLIQKQKELEDLMDKVMPEDLKQIMEEMEKMLDKLDKNELQKQLEEMKMSNEDLEKELDRSLEWFKQLDFEKKLEESIDKLEELKKKQEALNQKTEDSNLNENQKSELSKEQEKLAKEAEELEKLLEELNQKNENLEKPNEIPEEAAESVEQAKEEMEKSSESLNQGNKKQAKEKQKKVDEMLEKAQQSLMALQQEMQDEKLYEDMESLRATLENIVSLSFEQEVLILETRKLKRNDPLYVGLTQEQKRLRDNSKVIEDSLKALGKRILQIEPQINREIAAVKNNMSKSIDELADRKAPNAASKQQFAMTSLNNLALLLDEILSQMQDEANSKMDMKGDGQCKKLGSGKPSMGDMKKMQKDLNDQLKKMQEEMGKKEGGKKPGEKPGQGSSGMSQEIVKMAAKQAAIRQELQMMQDQMSKEDEGKQGGGGGLKKMIDLMEETEKDLVNWNLNRETLKRQEEILSRLLESEKAEREQEMDKKRESKEATNIKQEDNERMREYFLKKQKEVELLRTLPIELTPFYKLKVEEYINE